MEPILTPYQPKQRFIPKKAQPELQLHKEICRYIRLVKPNLMFRSDTSSGRYENSNFYKNLKVAMNSSRAWPDLMIYKKQTVTLKDGTKKSFCGMALELKKAGTTIIVTQGSRKGHLTSDPHIQEQARILRVLANEGWYTNFACGWDEFEYIFCWYFGLPKPDNTKLF